MMGDLRDFIRKAHVLPIGSVKIREIGLDQSDRDFISNRQVFPIRVV